MTRFRIDPRLWILIGQKVFVNALVTVMSLERVVTVKGHVEFTVSWSKVVGIFFCHFNVMRRNEKREVGQRKLV